MAVGSQSSRITRRQLLTTTTTAALSTAPFIVPNRVFAQTPAASPEASPVATGPQLYVSATDIQFEKAFEIGGSPACSPAARLDVTESPERAVTAQGGTSYPQIETP